MNLDEKKIRNLKMVVVASVTVVVVLMLLLITLVVQKTHLTKMKASLENEISQIDSLTSNAIKDLEDKNSLDFIEKMARELGLIANGETLYTK